VEVLGTHFNVNAYDNEQTVDATLLEGSIKIGGVLLKSGQQAKVGQQTKVRDNVDVDKVMAWKNGLFDFDGVSLAEVMAQIERWYDVEVVYENGIPDIQFGGEVSRDLNLAALLRTLGKAGVHYRMEDNRRLVIMK
jgi:ferric-dicitrate binding protein FerR (iron transport regulator)